MNVEKYFELTHLAENLKNNTRHSVTSSGREESIAEHSWRLAFMAYFLKDEYENANIEKIMLMCIFHDIGEAFTGDIPVFEKEEANDLAEKEIVDNWLQTLGEPYCSELKALFEEMEEQKTLESKIYKALDKLEAVIQHNEADISSWLELEYDLQLNHGQKDCSFSDYMKNLRSFALNDTIQKIKEHRGS